MNAIRECAVCCATAVLLAVPLLAVPLLVVPLLVVLAPSPAAADVFVLAGGGQIDGDLLNAEQEPRQDYVVQTATGRVTLPKDRVIEVVAKSRLLRFYEQHLPKVPDTAAGHWEMAEKCLKVGLKQQHVFHLERVLKFDPEHVGARHGLGYSQVNKRWVRTNEFMTSRGYTRHAGGWRLAQELKILQHKDDREDEVNDWRKKIRMWRGWVVKPRGREGEAVAAIRAIDRQRAAPALTELLKSDKEPPALKLLYIEVLGKLKSNVAVSAFINRAINDPNGNVRDRCLDELHKFGREGAAASFLKSLANKDPLIINRAAYALGRLKYEPATAQLIPRLITQHKHVLQKRGGNIGATFGNNGLNSFSAGNSPKVVEVDRKNESVLRALSAIHQGVSFGFNEREWHAWYVDSQTPKDVNLRRPID